MKSQILTCLILCGIVGCDSGAAERYTSVKENARNQALSYQETCVNGVVYYIYGRGMSAAFDKNSKVITCQ